MDSCFVDGKKRKPAFTTPPPPPKKRDYTLSEEELMQFESACLCFSLAWNLTCSKYTLHRWSLALYTLFLNFVSLRFLN